MEEERASAVVEVFVMEMAPVGVLATAMMLAAPMGVSSTASPAPTTSASKTRRNSQEERKRDAHDGNTPAGSREGLHTDLPSVMTRSAE
jgi:hypothetical protein